MIDFLIELGKSHQVITLKGNHEVMMENARLSDQELYFWLFNGGEAAIASFGFIVPLSSPLRSLPNTGTSSNPANVTTRQNTTSWSTADWNPIPTSKIRTTTTCTGNAFLRPNLTSQEKPSSAAIPHRVEGYPLELDHALCIDTFACRGGWLTCLDIDSGRILAGQRRG